MDSYYTDCNINQLATELSAVVAGQSAMAAALARHSETVTTQVTKVAATQQQMQSGLDVLVGTTGQTALDVLQMASRQERLDANLQGYTEAADRRTAQLTDNQQAIQNNLDILTATAGQVALDVIALSNTQATLERAVQANRQEFTAKLSAMADDRQNWRERLDASQARVEALAEGVGAIEKRMGTLKSAVQTSLTDVASLVDTSGQERVQFEAKVSQDMQALVEAVSQLRQMQTTLHEQMTQVRKTTSNQAEDLKAAIEEIKEPPAELKVSDATGTVKPAAQTGD
jgi:hypothetical protein